MPEDGYKSNVVTCASDRASVKFGKKTGLMKRMVDERVWQIKTHCGNLRAQEAVKEGIIVSKFKIVHNTYLTVFSLLKHSGNTQGM